MRQLQYTTARDHLTEARGPFGRVTFSPSRRDCYGSGGDVGRIRPATG